MKTKAAVLDDVILFRERNTDRLFLGVVINSVKRGFNLEDPRIYVGYSDSALDLVCFRTKATDGDSMFFEYLENLGQL